MRCIACDKILEEQKGMDDDELCNYCLTIAVISAEELDNDEK